MNEQIKKKKLRDFSVDFERLMDPYLHPQAYKQLLTLWQEKGSRNWFRPMLKEGWRERRQFCESLRNKDKIKPFVLSGSQSERILEDLVAALEQVSYDPLLLFNCLGVSPFNVLYEIETAQYDIAHRRELRLRLNNKAKRTRDIDQIKKAISNIRLYEEFLNDEICADYETNLARMRLLDRKATTITPHSITGRLKALCRLIENPSQTMKRLWLVDIVKQRSPAMKGAPTKDELRLAIASVINACSPIFGKEENVNDEARATILMWRQRQVVLKMKWPLVTAILTYAFPKEFNDPTDKHRPKTVKQRLKRTKGQGETATLETPKQKAKRQIRTVKQHYRQQTKEWDNAYKKGFTPHWAEPVLQE
jgi:hypothetical protein